MKFTDYKKLLKMLKTNTKTVVNHWNSDGNNSKMNIYYLRKTDFRNQFFLQKLFGNYTKCYHFGQI